MDTMLLERKHADDVYLLTELHLVPG
jgi:hypothetical protein